MRMLNSVPVARIAMLGLSCTLGLALSACSGGLDSNHSMYSVHQPVVEKAEYALDLNTNASGLGYGELTRLTGWFDALGLQYGDKIYIEDPIDSPDTRASIMAVASRYNIQATSPTTVLANTLPLGMVRVTVSRAKAHVPNCPSWHSTAKSDMNFNNGLSSNFGCAVNTNLAAMIANPEDLLQGAKDTGSTSVMTSNKAIDAYRKAVPTGEGNVVNKTSTQAQAGDQ